MYYYINLKLLPCKNTQKVNKQKSCCKYSRFIWDEGDNNQFKWVKTNDPSKKISPHYTIGRKEGGLAHLEVDLANWSLAGEPFDRISVALILSIDLDVKDLMDFGDWPSSVRESVITNKIWEKKFKHRC